MAEIKVWNNSALTRLLRCGEQFRRHDIEGEELPPTPRMVRGSTVHRVACVSMLRKMADPNDLPTVEEARDLAATEFSALWGAGVRVEDEDVEESGSEGAVQGASKDFAVDLSALYVSKVAPAINPIGVERKIVVEPQDSDLVIHGTIDLIDQQPTGEIVRDVKTSVKSPSRGAADASQQISLYGLLRLVETGTMPAGFRLDYLVRTPARKEVKYVPIDTTRTAEDVQAVVNRLNTAVEAVKKGVFLPAPADAWWCSRSYCDYYATCPYVRRSRRPEAA